MHVARYVSKHQLEGKPYTGEYHSPFYGRNYVAYIFTQWQCLRLSSLYYFMGIEAGKIQLVFIISWWRTG